ncbi:MAG: D-glycerate dehydrogenase [Anaerolineae bacterium]|nr:D-glycerate dehydrogenase [Anaerolineae bacterium]
MTKPNVFVTRHLPDAALDMLRQACDLEIWPDELPPPYDTLKAKAATVDGLLTLLSDQIDQELLHSAPQLRVVSQCAVGYDNIDVAAATAAHIPVGHTPGVLTDTTADFAFALLMAAARRIEEAARYVHAGKWRTWGPTLLMGQDVWGATLGIIGMGRIGQAMARRGRGFNMRVLYTDAVPVPNDAGAAYTPLDNLLAQADFVSLHVPLTPETHHLIDRRALKLMKSSAVLINTARGPVVDPQALYAALAAGEIAYAALDVTDPEPIPPDDPLLTLANCLIVPHIASSSVRTRTKMAVMAAENLLAGLAGKPLPYCVNPAVYNTAED